MTVAVPCKKDKIDKIPAVLHVDNTCRIQTLTEKQNKNMYIILKMFYKETGVPMLLNTSFNLAGMPLVSKEEMLEKTMNNSKIDFLFRLKDNNV